ncbi:O-antigen ligase family protein [Sphingomonas sp. DG1-23]|uniref:O-antigen ligase family protein n=1 Tax=Sphingomonas sp. DG1-23 TaxID=3068316 RepID=UPI00273F0C69|nr:O-antigen ligase family protein [Sphingomonas sp. DG1-23]MDP5280685.1 O-antigen ligase family protein [Sphingomonas sp. DG1-23]
MLTFFLGGGARSDIQSLAILRPIAVLVGVGALFTLSRQNLRDYRALLILVGAAIAIVAIQLVPLPPGLWRHLGGHDVVVEIDAALGLDGVWRPITMVPDATFNALAALFVPAATLLLAIQLSPEERQRLLPLLVVLGLISGFLGLLQVVGPQQGPLYFYRITNHGSAVGLFSNRNHAAIFLATLFPMLAVLASHATGTEQRARFLRASTLIVGTVMVPLMLVTGSRAGLVVGAIGLASVFLLFRAPAKSAGGSRRKVARLPLLVIAGGAALALVTVLFSRAEALQRLLSAGQNGDLRFRVWGPILDLSWKYFPFGSGVGSFAEVYQIYEQDGLLATRYLNHAHNDWLETLLTGGLPAIGLAVAAVLVCGVRSFAVWRQPARSRTRDLARMSSVILLLLILSSLADYPLRVPSLASLSIIAAVLLFAKPGKAGDSSKNNAGS